MIPEIRKITEVHVRVILIAIPLLKEAGLLLVLLYTTKIMLIVALDKQSQPLVKLLYD